jgi:hypothetical protein
VSKLHSPVAASLDTFQFPAPPPANPALQSSSLLHLSPYHQNIERIGWYGNIFLLKYILKIIIFI